MTNKNLVFVDVRRYQENVIETIPDAPQAAPIAQQESKELAMTEAERKKAEDVKRINAFIDKHESVLLKLAK
ncbi:MAG: hypothetical protein WCK96_03230 [Methylococcales bacterium]